MIELLDSHAANVEWLRAFILPALTAFSLGILGSLHCVTMCGGISCALGSNYSNQSVAAVPSVRWSSLLTYNFGRISSYMLIGLVFGFGSQVFIDQWQALSFILRLAAGLLLILMGLYIAGVSRFLVRLEALGFQLWRRLMSRSGVAINSERQSSLLLVGLVWGWLPCGLVYSTLLWAGALGGGGLQTGLLMGLFGLGTLPALLATGYFAENLRMLVQAKSVRSTAGLCIIVYGLWTILSVTPIVSGLHGSHNEHQTGSSPSHSSHSEIQHIADPAAKTIGTINQFVF